MAPGRKHNNTMSFKPSASYVHPSLRIDHSQKDLSSSSSRSDSSSVSDRIQYLRKVQRPSTSSVAELEKDTASLKISSPPRSRVPGPAPPPSWISGASGSGSRASRQSGISRPTSPAYFPGIDVPPERSLTHMLLKQLAQNIHWHLAYDHIYLSALPVDLKCSLLSYVVSYGPPDGISASQIKTVFTTPEASSLEAATGAEGLNRLDLATSIGRSISFGDLTKLWLASARQRNALKSAVDGSNQESTSPPESWEDSWEMWQPSNPAVVRSNLRFPSVTKLSLAFPGPEATWSHLITFSRHLGQLTHLSLASWPQPTVPFDNALMSDCPDLKRVIAREHGDIACDVIRVISRNTPSLTYLSLADCHAWFSDLCGKYQDQTQARSRATRAPRADVSNAFDDVSQQSNLHHSRNKTPSIWSYVWRHLTVLDLSQSKLPPSSMDICSLRALYAGRRWRVDENLFLISGRLSQPEEYTVAGPSAYVKNVARRQEERHWHNNEAACLNLGAHINRERHRAGLKVLDIRYGWDKDELREAGYSREEIWNITGSDG